MASPPIPPLLGHLAARPFSFYPAIRLIEHNEWLFRKATWSELVVVNHKSGAELSIPRRFVGEVSSIEDPVLIVGLSRELEYRDGAVWPYRRRVIEMPIAVNEGLTAIPSRPRPGPAPVVGIRLESRRDNRVFKLVGGALAMAIFLHLAAANLMHVGESRQRWTLLRDRSYLDLTDRDDYASVVQKLGRPSADRSMDAPGGRFRALAYAARKYTVILRANGGNLVYVGTVDDNWRPIHSVEPGAGGTAFGLPGGLKKF